MNTHESKLTIECVKSILRKDDLEQLSREVIGDVNKMYLYASDSFPGDVTLREAFNESLKIIEANDEREFLRKLIEHDPDFLENLAWANGDDFNNQDTVNRYKGWINEKHQIENLIDQAKDKCLGKTLFYVTIQTLKTRTNDAFQSHHGL